MRIRILLLFGSESNFPIRIQMNVCFTMLVTVYVRFETLTSQEPRAGTSTLVDHKNICQRKRRNVGSDINT